MIFKELNNRLNNNLIRNSPSLDEIRTNTIGLPMMGHRNRNFSNMARHLSKRHTNPNPDMGSQSRSHGVHSMPYHISLIRKSLRISHFLFFLTFSQQITYISSNVKLCFGVIPLPKILFRPASFNPVKG